MEQANIQPITLAQRVGLSQETIRQWMIEKQNGGKLPVLREYVQFCAEVLNLEAIAHDELLIAAKFDTFAARLNRHLQVSEAALAQSLNVLPETVKNWTLERKLGGQLPAARHDAAACAKELGLNIKQREEFLAAAGFPSFAALLSRHIFCRGIPVAKLAQNMDISRTNIIRWMKSRQNGGNPPTSRKEVEHIVEALHLYQTQTHELLEAAGFTPTRLLSPCLVNSPVQMPVQFFGRKNELKRITDLWTRFPLQNIAVIGPKGMGKTSLLNYLYHLSRIDSQDLRPGQRHDWFAGLGEQRWVKVDFNDSLFWNKERFFGYLLKELSQSPASADCDWYHAREIIEQQHLGVPTFILLDNIDVGLSAPELDLSFWSGLRPLCMNSKSNLAFLITSPQAPEPVAKAYGKPSPFFNVFGQVLRLGPLFEDEARELLQFGASQAQLPAPLTGDEIDWILEQSGRCPMLLQKMCHCRFQALKEGKAVAVWQEECLALRGGMSDLLMCD
jgi:transposase-like protein